MKNITFREFCKDYSEYYQTKEVYIATESDMQEVIWELYDTENFEINYDNKIIEIY